MRILAMAGSTRRDSFNRKLLAVGVKAAEAAGAEVEVEVTEARRGYCISLNIAVSNH